jgi:Protein of unknown function (DUF3638)/Protein of unknown function (DUF3645)
MLLLDTVARNVVDRRCVLPSEKGATASELYKGIGRVTVLPAIATEAVDYYNRILNASSQIVKPYTLPFHRDVRLDKETGKLLSDEIERCRATNGFFIVTPQHRNSLLLKQYDQDVFVEGLREQFMDIIDESDAILSHEFQLVYALGCQKPLPAGSARWLMVQALLTLLSRSTAAHIINVTSNSELVHRESSGHGSFPKLRLLLPFKGHEPKLAKALCLDLLVNPPYELQWMRQLEKKEAATLVDLMSDPNLGNALDIIEANVIFKDKASAILSARGLLAFGLLFHGLESRYGVNYGFNPILESKMAVPYAGTDTPKGRAQYSHPDMEIVYTVLAYYHVGLTTLQMKETVTLLQSMGPSAQSRIYGEWIHSVGKDVASDDLLKFNEIGKLDVDNKLQMTLVHANLSRCMEVVSFWTNNFVFPTDTNQFPARRASNAWNLCDSGRAIGFSGTDDNRYLLPLSISQIIPDQDDLRGTNGSMIRLLLERVIGISQIPNDDTPTWKLVLHQSVTLGASALIDVAGLMAGSRNDEAAAHLAERLRNQFRGVVYFDAQEQSWMVLETEYLDVRSLSTSSVLASECFVYFDESRCRGVDMKLSDEAVAVVTLEPKMKKDKFLQGCARMRKLERGGQRLILVGTSEVISSASTVKSILEKILQYTTSNTAHDIPTFYQRGLNFCSFPTPIEDDFSLERMYGAAIPEYENFSDFLDSAYETESIGNDDNELLEDLVTYCSELGEGVSGACPGKIGEECEQELENEVEHEEEKEVEISVQFPRIQEDWDFHRVFTDPEPLFKSLFVPLESLIRNQLKAISQISWSKSIFCTPNFWNTVQGTESVDDVALYLRPVNAMLVMATDSRVVLISIYELNKLLPHWWRCRNNRPKVVLQHLALSCVSEGLGQDDYSLSHDVLSFVKLFRGYVHYTENQRRILVAAFRRILDCRLVLQRLLQMRGRLAFLDRSDIDDIATQIRR